MTVPDLKSQTFQTPTGTKTHYLQAGDPKGPLLLCLHGLGGSTETFVPLLPYVPKTYNIVLVDFPGFGKTPLSGAEPLSVTGHVSDLYHLIAYLQTINGSEKEAEKVIIIGHSLGAIVALHYAAQHPESVAGLALLGSGRSAAHIPAVRQRMTDLASNTRKQGIAYAADLATVTNVPPTEKRGVSPEVRQAIRDAVAGSDPEGYAQTCEMMVDPGHVDPDYSKITCPAVFVAGDLDGISPVERSHDLSKLVGGDSSVEIVKGGHQLILEDTQGSAAAVAKLLSKVTA